MCGDDGGGGPGSLEVEAAGHGIGVERLAGKEKTGEELGFQRIEMNAGEGDAAAGHELFLEAGAAGDRVGVGGQRGGEPGRALAAELGPAKVLAQAGTSRLCFAPEAPLAASAASSQLMISVPA